MFLLCVTNAVALLVTILSYLIIQCYRDMPPLQLMIVDFIREDISKLMPINLIVFSSIVTYRELVGPLPTVYPELAFVSAIVVHSLIFNLLTFLNVIRCMNIIRFSAVNSVMDSEMQNVARIASVLVSLFWICLLVYFKHDNSFLSPPIFLQYQANLTEKEAMPSFTTAQSTTTAIYLVFIVITNTIAHGYVEFASITMEEEDHFKSGESDVRRKIIVSRVGVTCFTIVMVLWGTVLFAVNFSKSLGIILGLSMITTTNVILPCYFIFISRKLRTTLRRKFAKILRILRPARIQPY